MARGSWLQSLNALDKVVQQCALFSESIARHASMTLTQALEAVVPSVGQHVAPVDSETDDASDCELLTAIPAAAPACRQHARRVRPMVEQVDDACRSPVAPNPLTAP